MEQRKDIPWYEGRYQVSDHGRVKSLARTKKAKRWWIQLVHERILQLMYDKNWYAKVGLRWVSGCKRLSVHRLVLLTFVWPSELVCNHKNGIKNDNRLDNLEWCTQKENNIHSYAVLWKQWPWKGKYGYNSPCAKRIRNIWQYSLEWILLRTWQSSSSAGRELWFDPSSITAVCKWRYETSKWFIWRYT